MRSPSAIAAILTCLKSDMFAGYKQVDCQDSRNKDMGGLLQEAGQDFFLYHAGTITVLLQADACYLSPDLCRLA